MDCTPFSLLSWNARGLNARARRDAVRTLVDDTGATIICIQETKLNLVPPESIISMLGPNYRDYVFLLATHNRGDALIACRSSLMTLSEALVGAFSVTAKVSPTTGDDPWWFTCVYGPQSDDQKALFLEELAAIRDTCQGAWVVAGDFNMIINEHDKNNARINRQNMSRFRRTVNELELKDLHLHGRLFTWSNERERPTLVKLDRVLCSPEWEELFPYCYLQALSTGIADHCPLLLQSNSNIKAKPRFHFEVFWSKFDDFLATVEHSWKCDATIVNPFRRLDCLLRNVTRSFKAGRRNGSATSKHNFCWQERWCSD